MAHYASYFDGRGRRKGQYCFHKNNVMCLTCVKQVTVKQLYLLKKMTDIKENKNAITFKSPCDSMIINSGCQGLV